MFSKKRIEFLPQILIFYLGRRSNTFQTMNSIRSNNIALKYKRFTPSGCEDVGIRKFEFVARVGKIKKRII